MTTTVKRKKIIQEINSIPENFLDEVYSFLESFKFRKINTRHLETTIASESSLAKDWLKHEEDKAWENL
jgi:hypothetical protein